MAASSKVQLKTDFFFKLGVKRVLKCKIVSSYILVNMKRVGFSITMNFVLWQSAVSIHFHVVLIPFQFWGWVALRLINKIELFAATVLNA